MARDALHSDPLFRVRHEHPAQQVPACGREAQLLGNRVGGAPYPLRTSTVSVLLSCMLR